MAEAQTNLGIRYWHGEHVPRDRVLPYAWMRKAGGQGDIAAVQRLMEFEKRMSAKDVRKGKNSR